MTTKTSKPSTDHLVEAILYSLAEKQKRGLNMEESVRRAKNDILHFWVKDMEEIEMTMLQRTQPA